MKIYILIIFSLFFLVKLVSAQLVNLPLIMTNGVATDTLYFGVDPLGTDGIDAILGEQELPPLPPQDIFDVRFISDFNLPIQIGEGLEKDFRYGIQFTTDTIFHKINFRKGTGTILKLTYDFPIFVKVKLIDDFGGIILNDSLIGSGNYTLSTNAFNLGKFNFVVIYVVIMPVELSSFSCGVFDNNVKLKWETTSEINNSGFEVQRKKLNNSNWVISGFVSGAGTSNERNSYEYYDNNVPPGKYNYRLKQIDLNGNFEYFNLTEIVEINNPDDFYLYQNYPNPFNPATTIKFKTPADGNVRLSVYNIDGKLINTILNEFRSAGYYEINFSASNFSSGVYYYRLENNNNVLTKQFVVVK